MEINKSKDITHGDKSLIYIAYVIYLELGIGLFLILCGCVGDLNGL